MARSTSQQDVSDLPEPIALTPDQLQEVAETTAGGCTCVTVVIVHTPIRAGGIPVA